MSLGFRVRLRVRVGIIVWVRFEVLGFVIRVTVSGRVRLIVRVRVRIGLRVRLGLGFGLGFV